MNKIERVAAALKGEPVDRTPASFWFHFPSEKTAGKAMAEVHLDYYRFCNLDFLKVMNDNGYETPAGSPDKITAPEQWAELEPTPLSAKCFQDQLSGLKLICDELKDDCLAITTVFCPFATGNRICNGKVTEHVKKNPEAVAKGLAAIAQSLAVFARACVDVGAAGIFFSAQGGDAGRFTDEEFDSVMKPADVAVFEAVSGAPFNLLHVCGEGLKLERYADYPATAVNWSTQWDNLSIPEGRKLFDRTIVGGIDQRGPMVGGTRDAIRSEVDKALEEGDTAAFVLGAGCTFPGDIAYENIKFVMDHLAG